MNNRQSLPVIGIAAGMAAVCQPAFPGMVVERAFQNRAYLNGIEKNGGIPLMLPPITEASVHSLMTLCDGFLLPGGEDVDPRFYGEPLDAKCGMIHTDIDRLYQTVCEYAVLTRKPILGICKGMQFINVFFGGSLYQDLSLRGAHCYKHMQQYDRRYTTHRVEIAEGSVLRSILSCGAIDTNTMHHQSVNRVGAELSVTAQTGDGIVEAVEHGGKKILGVQWHPEELTDSRPEMNQLFRWLTDMSKIS